jgi:pyridoxamine 5'-phosphate oxidase
LDTLADVEELRAKALELGAEQRPLPCPPTFAAFHMELAGVEFWANGTDRLHERLRYDLDGDTWQISRLQP